MMKKMVIPVILTILAGLVFAAFFSCNTGTGVKGPDKTIYTGKDTDGKEYKLIVIDYRYDLEIDGESISTGKVAKMGDILILTPNSGGDDFEITVDGNDIIKIEGDISPDDGGDPQEPGEILPPSMPVEGNWIWFTSDDSKTNEYLDVQTTFPPGGVSKITNAQDTEGPDGEAAQEPFEYPEGTVKDNDGKTITEPVFNFTGNTKVDPKKPSGNSGATFGAGWPLVGWEAQPADDETLALLKTAYGYSFWVRLNSSKTNNDNKKDNEWAYLTQVVTDFPREKGYEYKHWFGNKPGDSGGGGAKNLTSGLKAGTWHKITVIMDKSGLNMQQDNWLFAWPPTPDPKGPFNQNKAEKIQWQIPLQHNGGEQRDGVPYDQVTGTHDFNLDFYGLRLLTK
jgi:hypothetical protein